MNVLPCYKTKECSCPTHLQYQNPHIQPHITNVCRLWLVGYSTGLQNHMVSVLVLVCRPHFSFVSYIMKIFPFILSRKKRRRKYINNDGVVISSLNRKFLSFCLELYVNPETAAKHDLSTFLILL